MLDEMYRERMKMYKCFMLQQPDPLFELVREFKSDTRQHKVDMVIGVYKDDHGETPVMDVVHQAEVNLLQARVSKAYKTPVGNEAFNLSMSKLLLGNELKSLGEYYTISTIGATGGLRLIGEFIALHNPNATIWSTDPGYINHQAIFTKCGLSVEFYRWQNINGQVDVTKILEDLEKVQFGDVILLHGCCHNPTGLDLSLEGWKVVADFCKRRGLIPFIDIAYQGFGDGLEADAEGLRYLANALETLFITASCSKNMSLYCERTGVAMILSPTSKITNKVKVCMENLARMNYSMPANHGAAIATQVLNNQEKWCAELEKMRIRISSLRSRLVDNLSTYDVSENMLDMRYHKGMFSMLPFDKMQMQKLKEEYAIYGTDNGRINIAGMSNSQIDYIAHALAAVEQNMSLAANCD